MKDCWTETTAVPSENQAEAVVTFEAKGYNQGYNQKEKVTTANKSFNNNDLTQSVKWIKVSEGYNRLGISQQAINKHISKGHFVTRKVKMNGGFGYEISVESMFSYYETLGDWEKCERILEIMREMEDGGWRLEDGSAQSAVGSGQLAMVNDVLMAKYQVAKLFDNALEFAEKKSVAAERFAASFNNGVYPELKNLIGEVSVRSLYRWRQLLQDNDWEPGCLADNYKPIICGSISNKEAEVLIPLLLNPNKPLVSEIIAEFKRQFSLRHPSVDGQDHGKGKPIPYKFKSDVTYRRFIDDWKRKNIDLYTLGRYGMKAFNDRILKDILRDKDRVEVGDIVVADGHKMNVMVINPLTGKPMRMTLIMFYDFKSDMPLGWEIMPSENVLTIASALRRTILMLGRFFDAEGYVPKAAYLDNGRAFRGKYFNGIKDFKDSIIPGLFGKLKMEVMFATPYHGQSKTIERWFKTLGQMERHLPSYTGTNIDGKPAMMLRNEKLHKRLFDNTAITVETLQANLQAFIEEYASQPHQDGQYKGLTPAEIFMHSVEKIKSGGKYTERLISRKELIYLMMSDESRQIGKNGIRFRGQYYWNEEMMRIIGSKVDIKYDLWDDSEVYVFERNKMLFIAAKDDYRYHPAARLLGDEEDVRMLTDALKNKERRKQEVVAEFKELVKMSNVQCSTINDQLKMNNERMKKSEKKQKLSESQRKLKLMKELGMTYNAWANPVEELLKRGVR